VDPPVNRGSAITSYTVIMKTAGGQSRTVAETATSLVWDNLTNGTDYSFTVQATNNSGTSVESDIGTGRPSAPPDCTGGHRHGRQRAERRHPGGEWHVPTNNGEPITSYLLNVSTNKDSFTVDGPRTPR
jgi:hypothetical protein